MTERYIDDRWYESDVLNVRTDLTSDQAWEVLLFVKNTHDASIGINWDVLKAAAEELYPEEITEDDE
jgi:hypothetical protein